MNNEQIILAKYIGKREKKITICNMQEIKKYIILTHCITKNVKKKKRREDII